MKLQGFKVILFLFMLVAHASGFTQTLAKTVDLEKYAGKWFVIACIPTEIDQRWNYVTETYTLKKNGKIDIYTTFVKEYKPGSKKTPKQKRVHSKVSM